MRKQNLILIFILIFGKAFGGTLTLKEAISLALMNNEELRNTYLDLEVSGLNLLSAQKEYKPKMGLEGEFQRIEDIPSSLTSDKHTASFGFSWPYLIFSSKLTPVFNYSLTRLFDEDPFTPLYNADRKLVLTWSYALSKGGRIKEKLSLIEAHKNRKIKEIEYTLKIQKLILDVTTSYLNLLQAQGRRRLIEEQVELSHKLLELSREKLKAGQIPELDMMNVEVRLAQDEDSLIQAKDEEKILKRNFTRLLGLKEAIEISLAEEPKDSIQFRSYDECVKEAIENREEIKMLEIKLDESRRNIFIAQSTNKLFLTLEASYIWEGRGEDLKECMKETKAKNWAVSCKIFWSFFDSGATANQVKIAQLNYKSIENELEKLKKNIVDEVYEFYHTLETSLRRLKILTLNLKMAEEAYEITKLKYEMGLVTIQDLLSAKLVCSEIKNSILSARINFLIAKNKLFWACGNIGKAYGF